MSVHTQNPAALFQPAMYSQLAVAAGTRTVFVAGQAPFDASGKLVGSGDLAAQTEQVLRNIATALAAAGASFQDVGRLTIYLVGSKGPSTMEQLGAGYARAIDAIGADVAPRPVTMVVVAGLAVPEQLIEIEATAVLA
ncbi:MAG: RidA family protein [Burkholderiaceae bacterium]